jgi:hypothetical protein
LNAVEVLALLPPDQCAALLPHLAPSIARAHRTAQRDAALVAALALMEGDNPTARAANLERSWRRYLAGGGWKAARHRSVLSDDATAWDVAIHTLSRLNDGRGLAWRRILYIAANSPAHCKRDRSI